MRLPGELWCTGSELLCAGSHVLRSAGTFVLRSAGTFVLCPGSVVLCSGPAVVWRSGRNGASGRDGCSGTPRTASCSGSAAGRAGSAEAEGLIDTDPDAAHDGQVFGDAALMAACPVTRPVMAACTDLGKGETGSPRQIAGEPVFS